MQEYKISNDVLFKSIGQFLQQVLPTTTTPVPVLWITAPTSNEVEALHSSKIERGEKYTFGPTATPIQRNMHMTASL
jgi:hypothetical protein